MDAHKIRNIEEKRKYTRLSSVFPIEFQLVNKEDRTPISELYEGFTRNVGKGGMGIFAKTLKEKDKKLFDFAPRETKLKVIINIPLDKEPIESFATIEWIEKQPGPIVDTYYFGISYDFINELEYEKIVSYVKWLRLKPRLILAAVILLVIAAIGSLAALYEVNKSRINSLSKLAKSTAESASAKNVKIQSEKKRREMQAELEAAQKKQAVIEAAFGRLAEKKKALEEAAKSSEIDRDELQLQLEEITEEKALLEEKFKAEVTASTEAIKAEKETNTPPGQNLKGVSDELLKSESHNYNKFRELILNEKLQSLSAYVSTHRSSIYHTAALFALAELRYKNSDRRLAAVTYNNLIERYPRSKYALYSSHRLEQLEKNYNYDFYSLKDFYDTYNLEQLFDYRSIEPYIK